MSALPRFSIRDLLLSTAFIAAGIVTLAIMLRGAPYTNPTALTMLLTLSAWMFGGLLLGAGVGALFKKPGRGAAWGLMVQFVLFIVLSQISLPP